METISPSHPHFENIAPGHYKSKATGQHVRCEVRPAQGPKAVREVVAIPVTPDGNRLPVHAEPLAWGSDTWEVLDKVHAQR